MNWGSELRGWFKHIEITAIVATVIAVASLMLGQSAERYAETESQMVAQAGATEQTAGSHDKHAPGFNAIDYGTTGSIKGQTVVLSRCTGQQSPR